MDTVDIGRETARGLNSKHRRRPLWPGALLALFGAAGALKLFGPTVALVCVGVGAILASAAAVPAAKKTFWSLDPCRWRVLLAVWLLLSVALGASFISSGLGHRATGPQGAARAKLEATATLNVFLLSAMWLAAVRIPNRRTPAYVAAVTVILLEQGRLFVLGRNPGAVSFAVWLVAMFVAIRSFSSPKTAPIETRLRL